MASEIIIKIGTDGAEKSLKSINDLKGAITALESESANMDLGSAAFENSKNQIDELKKKLGELGKSQSKMDDEINERAIKAGEQRAQKMEAIGNNLQKFAAGLTDAMVGAMLVFGTSEKDAAAMNKTLQQGVGIAVGVKGAIEAIGAATKLATPITAAFNAVMAANPVMLIVIAVAALVAGIYLLNKAFNSEKTEVEKLTEALEINKKVSAELIEINNSTISVMEARITLMKSEGKTVDEIRKAEEKLFEAKLLSLNQGKKIAEESVAREKANLREIIINDLISASQYRKQASYQIDANVRAAFIKMAIGLESLQSESVLAAQQLLKTSLIDLKKVDDTITVAKLNNQAKINDGNTKELESEKKLADDKSKLWKENSDKRLKEKEDELLRIQAVEADAWWDNILAEMKAEADGIIELKKMKDDLLIYNRNADKENQAIENTERLAKVQLFAARNLEDIDARIAVLTVQRDIELQNELLTSDQKKLIKQEYITAVGIMEVEAAEKARQLKLQEAGESVQIGQDVTTSLQGLSDTVFAIKSANTKKGSKEEEENARKQFKINKAIALSSAILSGAQAVIRSLASAPLAIGIVPSPIGIASMVAAITTGLASVAKIAATQYKSTSVGSTPVPSLGGGTLTTGGGGEGTAQDGPSLRRIGRTPEEAAAAANAQGQRQPQKVYVVASDISSSLDQNEILERRSTF